MNYGPWQIPVEWRDPPNLLRDAMLRQSVMPWCGLDWHIENLRKEYRKEHERRRKNMSVVQELLEGTIATRTRVAELLQFFRFDHLQGSSKNVSAIVCNLAVEMCNAVPDDSAEFTAGLRKLLEAKDCFVRANIARQNRLNKLQDVIEGADQPTPLRNTPEN